MVGAATQPGGGEDRAVAQASLLQALVLFTVPLSSPVSQATVLSGGSQLHWLHHTGAWRIDLAASLPHCPYLFYLKYP